MYNHTIFFNLAWINTEFFHFRFLKLLLGRPLGAFIMFSSGRRVNAFCLKISFIFMVKSLVLAAEMG